MTRDGQWQQLFEAAALELDNNQLQARAEAAYAAIQQRMEELRHAPYYDTQEQQKLIDALHFLQGLQRTESENSGKPSQGFGESDLGKAI